MPRLALNREGDIQQFNGAARRVLEYGPEETPKQSFFSYVDGRNLQRVMWDLARMVNNRVKKARWLLRLSTGRSRWRWYRVAAQSKLRSEGVIELTVRPLETRHTGR